MGKTFAEKVIARKCGYEVSAGETVIVEVDVALASDTTAPLTIKAFTEMGGKRVRKPDQTVFVIDHATPCPNEKIANLHQFIRNFSREQGIILYDQGEGVCHQLMIEQGHVKEGDIVLGADSHTCTYGGIGALATGVGSTDLGAVLLTGKTWLRVPPSVKIVLEGNLPAHVTAKDVSLYLIGQLTIDGATYACVEFTGSAVEKFTLDERMTICNMAVEMGAKAGITTPAIKNPQLKPDGDAFYEKVLHYDLSNLVPQLACPHNVDNVVPAKEKAGVPIQQAYIGSCTNGRLSDLAVAAAILKNKRVASDVRLVISPASRNVYLEAMKRGYIQQLVEAGATVLPPGCGPCVGTLGGIPGDGEVVISTTNRNFKGRMGNNKACIYLASPATVAASVLTGVITSPEEVV